jgi:hypothetical protein
MVSEVPYVLRIMADTTEAESAIDRVRVKVDEVVAGWRQSRAEILQGLRDVSQVINYTLQTFRLAVRAVGGSLDPMQSAILGMISATVSMMLATATAMAAASLGILGGFALALASAAFGISIATSAKVIQDFLSIKENMDALEAKVAETIKLAATSRLVGGINLG